MGLRKVRVVLGEMVVDGGKIEGLGGQDRNRQREGRGDIHSLRRYRPDQVMFFVQHRLRRKRGEGSKKVHHIGQPPLLLRDPRKETEGRALS